MNTITSRKKIVQIISELFKDKGFDIERIEYVNLIEDLAMDSITFISMIVEIETEFNITIKDEMLLMNNFNSISAIEKVIESCLE